MTQQEKVDRLVATYATLATMNEHNLAYRIGYEALGTSDAAALAKKLIAIKDGKAQVSASAPEDEAIWCAAMAKAAGSVKPTAPPLQPAVKPAPVAPSQKKQSQADDK